MKLRELLQQMRATQEEIDSSRAYICGGTPRDRYLNRIDNIADLDITTGDKSVQYLAKEFGDKLAKRFNVVQKNYDDGHSSIYIGKFKMDFSSNFNVPNIDVLLNKQGIKNPTDMQREMFSRDFTCNALLLSLDLRAVTDPTNRGLKDIKEKKIKTCLAPEITLISNKNRVARAIYLACKLDFDIDDSIIEFVSKNPSSIKISSSSSLQEKLNSAFEKDADKASYYLSKMGLWGEVPVTEIMQPYYMKKLPKVAYFQGGGGVNEPTPKKKKYKSEPAIVNQTRFKEPFYRNYDLYDIPGFEHIGPGAGWHSMQKYKSVSEFLKAKRKKMKDKYKADDSWIEDSGKITKKNPNKIATRMSLLIKIAVNDINNIDFPDDQYIDPSLISAVDGTEDNDNPVGKYNLEGGYLDEYLPENDFEEKPPTELDFGRDYVEDEPSQKINPKDIEKLLDKYDLNGEYGLPDGVNLPDEDAENPDDLNPDYGTLGPESLIYEDKWNI